MLGMEDGGVSLAYILSIAGTILCVVYGFIMWNKGDEPVKQEDVDWVKEEVEETEKTL